MYSISYLTGSFLIVSCPIPHPTGSGTCNSILSETAQDKLWDLLQARPGYLLQLEKVDVEARFRELVPKQEKSQTGKKSLKLVMSYRIGWETRS